MRKVFSIFVMLTFIGLSNIFAQINLENGLVAKYYFNGNANDESGNSINGTVNGATLTTDRFGNENKAYSFDGNNSFIEIGDYFDNTSILTFSFWINPQTNPTTLSAVLAKYNSNLDHSVYYMGFANNNFRFGVSTVDDRNLYVLTENSCIQVNTWQHIVCIYDLSQPIIGDRLKLYYNGVLQQTSYFVDGNGRVYSDDVTIIENSAVPFTISKWTEGDGTNHYTNDKVDDVNIYNRTLNNQEIQALYNEGSTENLNNNLVAYYPFNSNANDESGNSNNGTVNGATLTQDRFGSVNKAYKFDGNNDVIECPALNFSNQLTVCAWVKYDTIRDYAEHIVNKYDGDPGDATATINRTFELYRHAAGYNYKFYFGTSGDGVNTVEIASTTTPQIDMWYYLTATFDNGTMKLFINGILENTQNAGFNTIYQSIVPVLIGAATYDIGSISNYTKSNIDDIRIYNRALTPTEITALYNETPISNLTVSTTSTDVTCTTTKNGIATVTVTEGTPPYIYLWSNNKTTPTISNLNAGTYTVTVTDANNNSATATAIVGRIYVCETKVRTIDCGITAPNLSKVIYCDNSYGATNYEWEITNSEGYSFTRQTGSNSTGFRLSWATGLEYGKTYNVRVRAYKNEMWSDFGATCEISIATIPVTQLKTLYCGASLTKFSQYIYCDAVVGATDYEWEFSNIESNYLFNRTRGNASNTMLLTSITGLEYGKTYDVRIRAKMGTQWGSFGSICTVTFVVPPTQVRADYCGITASSISKVIFCDAVTGANDYEWQFVNSASNFSATKLKGSTSTGMTLSSISGLQMNTTYEVKVRAKIGQIWGSFANACEISTPSLSTTQLRADFCGATLNSMSQYVFCNALLYATDYDWEFVNSSTGSIITKTRGIDNNNLLISSVSGLQMNATYIVRVRAKLNGVWSNFGTSCYLSTPAGTLQKNIDNNENTSLTILDIERSRNANLELSLIPNPVLKGNSFALSMLSDSKINDCKVNVYNIIGQIVFTKQLNIDENNYSLNIEQNEKFSSGLHIVQVEINGVVSRMKMIIE